MASNKKEKIVFVSICIILGIILSIQFKTAKTTIDKEVTPREREKELTLEYEKVLEEKEELEDTLSTVDDEIKKHEEIEKEKDSDIKELYGELEKYQMFVGFESMKGPGITIKIDEPSFQKEIGEKHSVVIANYDLILQLISRLNDLGAEGISINDERYTNYTSLEVNENSLKVNGISIQLPLEIKVIGNKDILEDGLNVKGNIMWNMQNKYLYNISIERKDNIIMEEFNKPKKLKYAKPVKNGEK